MIVLIAVDKRRFRSTAYEPTGKVKIQMSNPIYKNDKHGSNGNTRV